MHMLNIKMELILMVKLSNRLQFTQTTSPTVLEELEHGNNI